MSVLDNTMLLFLLGEAKPPCIRFKSKVSMSIDRLSVKNEKVMIISPDY